MDIDLSILRMLEREKEISFDVLVEAIEQALLTAYHKTPGAAEQRARRARPQDRPRHGVRRRARRRGQQGRGVRRHPRGLRPDRRHDREADHAAAAARRRGRHPVRRVLRQGGRHRLRRHPAGPQPRRRDGRPRQARGAAAGGGAGAGGALRARHPDQVPGRVGAQGHARAADHAVAHRTPTWSRSCSPSRSPRSPTAPSRSPRSPARPVTAPRSRCSSTQPGVNAKGACIGPMGQRVRNVMAELHGEKIDIVDWSDDPAELVAHALSPARVTSVDVVDAEARSARVVVPDFQLSLAIGKEGQNARLAARLTGWRIDIRSDDRAGRGRDGMRVEASSARFVCGRATDSVTSRRTARLPVVVRPSMTPALDTPPGPVRTCIGCRREPPRTSCCAWSPARTQMATRSSAPIRTAGHPDEGRTCTPRPSAWTRRCGGERSPGPYGSR